MKKIISKLARQPFVYWLLLGIVAAIFLVLAFTSAHRLPSRVDEGSFIIKGYYYVTDRYMPFQEYGPWTNNMPLAYYIPGLAQSLFGPGLRTGRYFAIFITFLTLTGLWVVMRRLRGKWWALLGVSALAINPSLIQTSVQAISQGIVACLLTWMLVCLLGEARKDWQIAAGALLCALTILTRQNMVLLLPLVWIYAFQLQGKRAGWLALVCSLLPLVVVHAIFYPGILNLWFSWMPRFLRYKLNMGLVTGGGKQTWVPNVDLILRITSFFTALRYHFITLVGALICFLLLPKKDAWQTKFERKTAFCLSAIFLVLFLMHAWASLLNNYCVYCFPTYITFFFPIGVILALLGISNLFERKPRLSALLVAGVVLILITGVFMGSIETVGPKMLALPIPRVKEGQIQSGSAELWVLFANRFGFAYDDLLVILPPAIGFFISIGLILAAWGLSHILRNRQKLNFGRLLMGLILVAGLVLTPTALLGQPPSENTCGGDVISAYEQVGSELNVRIPEGSSLYWAAGSVVTPLIYITDAGIHPPQLNGIYSKRQGGDRDLLEKAGYFNEESVLDWYSSDEFIINSNKNMVGSWLTILNPDEFNEYQHTSPLDPCELTSYLRIFKRKN